MPFLKKIKGGVYNGIGFVLVLGLTGVAYGAYVAMTDVTTGQPLTASTFNQVLENQRVIKSAVDGFTNVPAGAVIAFNLSSCPAGWLAANGASSTPDLRGEFIRGLDNGRGVDSGRTLASWQTPSLTIGDVLSHSMIVGFLGQGTNADRSEYGWENPSLSGYTSSFPNGGYEYNAATTVNYGGIDMATLGTVRPRNIALLYCVKQ